MKRKRAGLFAGMFVLTTVLLVAIVFRHFSQSNPYPDSGLLFDVVGINISEVDSIGMVRYQKVWAAETEEEVDRLAAVLNREVFFERKTDLSDTDGMMEWQVCVFMAAGYQFQIGITGNRVRLMRGHTAYEYRMAEEFDSAEVERLSEAAPSLYWPAKKDYQTILP